MNDTHARTLAKAVTFRIQTIALHWAITYLFTGSSHTATQMVAIITSINMIYYWLQERYFSRISYGWAGTDLKRRSLIKAVLYKTFSLIVSFTVGYIVLGDFGLASLLTLYKHITALVDFYLFERFWNWIKWGRNNSEKDCVST
jgi:uncharacterized membrane protein